MTSRFFLDDNYFFCHLKKGQTFLKYFQIGKMFVGFLDKTYLHNANVRLDISSIFEAIYALTGPSFIRLKNRLFRGKPFLVDFYYSILKLPLFLVQLYTAKFSPQGGCV